MSDLPTNTDWPANTDWLQHIIDESMANTHLHVFMGGWNTMIIERLKGKANYAKWLQQFESASEQKGYTSMFDGKETVITKPLTKRYLDAFRTQSTGLSTESRAWGIAEKPEGLTESIPARDRGTGSEIIEAEYELDCEEYEAQTERVRLSVILLYSSLDYSIRDTIRGIDNPKIAMDHINKLFGPSSKDDLGTTTTTCPDETQSHLPAEA